MLSEALILIGIALTFAISMFSSTRARHYMRAYTEEEIADFKKAFRFKFWLIITIASVLFLVVFAYLGYGTSSLMKGL